MRAAPSDILGLLRDINNFETNKSNNTTNNFETNKSNNTTTFKHTTYTPFRCHGVKVGTISETVLDVLSRFPEVFAISETEVTFNCNINGYNQTSQALNDVLVDLASSPRFPCLRGWRDECYVINDNNGQPLFQIERAAAPIFGIRKYGVRINGYVRDAHGEMFVWLQRRAYDKPTYPGKIDGFVGGGLTEGRGVLETAIKEGEEEAGLTSLLAAGLKSVGCVSYMHESERGLHPLTEYVFDLELPPAFVPENQDGEVEEWFLSPINKLKEIIFSEDFRLTSAPVVIDFLIRHGFLTHDNEPNLAAIIELLHPHLH